MKIVLSLSAALALAPSGWADGEKPKGKIVETNLTRIRQSPQAFRGLWVRFTVQFASMGKIQNPFFTEFEPSKFANFYCWPDEQRIWQKDEYENLFGLLFVSKDHAAVDQIYGTRLYDRLQITGVVRNTFQGEPWIEVMEFETISNKLNTATLSHLYRGETFMIKRRWKQAITELSLAPGDDLPEHVVGFIHKDLALCYLRLGEAESAVSHLERAVQSLGTIDDEIREMSRLAQVRPESFLDRTVGSSQVEDHERPMWEAFVEQDETRATPR